MKNIHLLPTDKPSRLSKSKSKEELTFSSDIYNLSNRQHIYITSDEEIKEDNWGLSKLNEVILFGRSYNEKFYKKIILTTDQGLIKDGVQAIDDEFLEWFVKNPSCEEVEVHKICYGALSGFADAGYKIIISKEEAKKVGEYQQELFSYLHDLGVTALQSEMQEIERIVLNMQQEQDKNKYSEEDIKIAFDANIKDWISFEEFIEQFKKK